MIDVMKSSLGQIMVGLVLFGCSSGDGGDGGNTGGRADQDGSGGAVGAGGAGSGGAPSTGGALHAAGGEGSAAGGAPAAAGGGSGGEVDGSGGGDGKAPVVPSTGCNKANPDPGSAGSPLEVAGHKYYVKLPTNYDAATPYPVVIMFHPTGNPIDWAEKNAGYEKNAAKDEAIRVYPASANNSSGWVASDVAFFEPFYEKVLGDYCVDESRVFAAGESSGGDFASILGCEYADKLRAIASCATKPVNQYPLDASTRQCAGQVTAIVIHGKMDSVVTPANGPLTAGFYRELNHCDDEGELVEKYSDTLSNCIKYDGCDDGYPVYFCQHTDPEYSGTNHGWPKFAGNMTWETFAEY